MVEFLRETAEYQVGLTPEQLYKLIDFYSQSQQMTPAYSRIDALHAISQIEANSSKAKDTPYLDELDEFYKEEF